VATGLETYGPLLGRLVRSRAVLSEQGSQHVPISLRIVAHPLRKHVSFRTLYVFIICLSVFTFIHCHRLGSAERQVISEECLMHD
jgi:hypothetical protein